jgi:hypothetical protein
MTPEPIQFFRLTRAALEEGTPLPPAAARWLRDGLRRYARGCATLDEALGLNVGRGEAHLRAARLIEQGDRDDLVLEIASHLDGTASAKATVIAEAVCEFGKYGGDGLPEAAALTLGRLVMRHGAKAPASRSSVLRILQGDTAPQRAGLVVRAIPILQAATLKM